MDIKLEWQTLSAQSNILGESYKIFRCSTKTLVMYGMVKLRAWLNFELHQKSQITIRFVECSNQTYPLASILKICISTIIFLAGWQVLNKGHTVWLEGAIPANTCIPPSISGNVLFQLHGIPNTKSMFASI